MMRFFGGDSGFATVQIGHQGRIPGVGQSVSHTPDLVIQAPPFLNHYNAGQRRAGGFSQITINGLAVRPIE